MPKTIDLGQFASPGVGVLAGRTRGELAREKLELDEIDKTNELVQVQIPEDIFSVNSSFFLGLFGESIIALGEDEFRRRYRFSGPGIDRVRDDGIRQALVTQGSLHLSRRIA